MINTESISTKETQKDFTLEELLTLAELMGKEIEEPVNIVAGIDFKASLSALFSLKALVIVHNISELKIRLYEIPIAELVFNKSEQLLMIRCVLGGHYFYFFQAKLEDNSTYQWIEVSNELLHI
jgi:hypothetical protein